MKHLLAFALTMSFGWCTPALAQDGWGWSVIIPSVTGTDQLGLHLRDQMARQRSAPPQASTPAAVPAAALRYTPSRARRTANLAGFVEKTRRTDPAGAEDLRRVFASGDFIDRVGQEMARRNLRVDDLADAYAVWWVSAWQASKGRTGDVSARTYAEVRGQAARALGGMPAFVRADDAARQQFAESLLVQAVLIDTAVEQSKNDPARLRQVGAAVAQGARGMGLDLSAMELTERGFVSA